MKLEEWLRKNDRTQGWFAKKINVSPPTIANLINGSDPRLSIALKVEDITKGEVTCRELLKLRKASKSH